MLLLLREQVDFSRIVLQNVGCDAETNARCATGDDEDLWVCK